MRKSPDVKLRYVGNLLIPVIPKSDQHLVSPENITSESNSKVTRIKEMITN